MIYSSQEREAALGARVRQAGGRMDHVSVRGIGQPRRSPLGIGPFKAAHVVKGVPQVA